MNLSDRIIIFKFMNLCLWGMSRILISLYNNTEDWEKESKNL